MNLAVRELSARPRYRLRPWASAVDQGGFIPFSSIRGIPLGKVDFSSVHNLACSQLSRYTAVCPISRRIALIIHDLIWLGTILGTVFGLVFEGFLEATRSLRGVCSYRAWWTRR